MLPLQLGSPEVVALLAVLVIATVHRLLNRGYRQNDSHQYL